MQRVYGIAAVLLAAAMTTGCGQGRQLSGEVAYGIVAREVLAKASLQYYWQKPIKFLDSGETVEGIWRLDENLYGLTSANRLIALDAATSEYKWTVVVAEPGRKVYPPCHANYVRLADFGGIRLLLDPPDLEKIDPVDCVVINTASYALLLDRKTGRQLRKLSFKFAANSPGTSDGIYFFVGSAGGQYYPVRLVDALTRWKMGTEDMISARPFIYDRRLYVGSRDGRLYVVNPYVDRDRHLWTRKTDGPLTADFFVDDRGCFVGSEDFNLYVYNPVDGGLLWMFQAQGPLREPVQVGERSVFQYADQDKFYALEMARGEKRWELSDGHFVVAVAAPNVCVLTFDRKLRIIHESLGREEITLPMTGLDLFARNATKDAIYAATRSGLFVCIRPASAGHLTAEMLKD